MKPINMQQLETRITVFNDLITDDDDRRCLFLPIPFQWEENEPKKKVSQ